jgi:two-component system, NtrC family, nitrogen regulation sensor histidine kinase NtrY
MNFFRFLKNYRVFGSFLTGSLLILCAILFRLYFSIQNTPEKIKINFEHELKAKEIKIKDQVQKLKMLLVHSSIEERIKASNDFQKLWDEEGLAFFAYEKDSLIFWSTNSVPFQRRVNPLTGSGRHEIQKLKNGWYEVIQTGDSSMVCIGLILLKHEYLLENEFLESNFEHSFRVPAGTLISFTKGNVSITSNEGHHLFRLVLPEVSGLSYLPMVLLFLLYFSGFILFIAAVYWLYLSYQHIFRHRSFFLLAFAADVVILRFVQFYFHIPHVLYTTELFGPGLFSSSYFLPSLGDFLINATLGLIIAFVIFRHFPDVKNAKIKAPLTRIFVCIVILVILVAGFWSSVELTRQLVINSTIPFTLENISGLSRYSVIGFLIIAFVFMSFLFLALRLLEAFFELSGIHGLPLLKDKSFTRFTMSGILFSLVFFAVTVTIVLDYNNHAIEKERRRLIALKLATKRDPVGEMLFAKQEEQMVKDPVLSLYYKAIPDTSGSAFEDSITDYLEDKYFKKDWTNYTIQITICSHRKLLRVQPQDSIINCDLYFQNVLKEVGKPTLSRHLYFLDYGYGYRNYLAIIPLLPDKKPEESYFAYVEISSMLSFKGLGYPELLIDKRQNTSPDIQDYSYAFYRNGSLMHRVGNLHYSLDLDQTLENHDRSAHFYVKNGISHYCYPVDNSTVFIISRNTHTLLDEIAPFSYLFIFFAFTGLIFTLLVRFRLITRISIFRLGDRIQVSMIGIMVASFLIVGVLVVYYLARLNANKNKDSLVDRTHSILVELEHKLGMAGELPADSLQDLNELMMKYSNIFFSDVNLFDPEARLIATSRPEIFEQGLISDLMNKDAYSHLKYMQSSLYIHHETIGRHGYYSAYIPFFNDRNKLLAYLNLPYFARQDDLKREISTFLVAFINIYVFLIIVGIFIVIIVTEYISRPLRMLASRLRQITLGKSNEKLEWAQKDEIGKLVEEYNRMIDELAKSAGLLARSERESAWREMARQVAHEIKNPLTPMKLNVQHLLKSWEDGSPGWDQRLKRFTEKMTEQIDTLAAIASEFSDFAKAPEQKNEVADLAEILDNSLSFYRDIPDIRISFNREPEPFFVNADRKQLMRVFSNLLNNSIQAIGDKKPGKIDIGLTRETRHYKITIEDNGTGIIPEQAGKIFQPNFTTKSGGMGLGLAIVRSIILNTGGEISFESTPGVKTIFYILLPQAGQTN